MNKIKNPPSWREKELIHNDLREDGRPFFNQALANAEKNAEKIKWKKSTRRVDNKKFRACWKR